LGHFLFFIRLFTVFSVRIGFFIVWLWCFESEQWVVVDTNALALNQMEGFLLGASVFTTFKLPQGECWLRAHLKRVVTHAKALGFLYPARFGAFAEATLNALTEAPSGVYRVTAVVSTAQASCWSGQTELALPTTWLLHRREGLVKPTSEAKSAGIYCITKPYTPALADCKQGSLLPAWLLRRQATLAHQADDVLWLNQTTAITEATSSNVFYWHFNGTLITPAPPHCLKGIARQQVLQVAKKLGFAVEEALIPLAWLAQPCGLFLTNSVSGLTPVSKVDNLRIAWHEEAQQNYQHLKTEWQILTQQSSCYR
jgi:branched-subunit amino acid aminotransferase/4-amino-4-deoxychorismate lyase